MSKRAKTAMHQIKRVSLDLAEVSPSKKLFELYTISDEENGDDWGSIGIDPQTRMMTMKFHKGPNAGRCFAISEASMEKLADQLLNNQFEDI